MWSLTFSANTAVLFSRETHTEKKGQKKRSANTTVGSTFTLQARALVCATVVLCSCASTGRKTS